MKYRKREIENTEEEKAEIQACSHRRPSPRGLHPKFESSPASGSMYQPNPSPSFQNLIIIIIWLSSFVINSYNQWLLWVVPAKSQPLLSKQDIIIIYIILCYIIISILDIIIVSIIITILIIFHIIIIINIKLYIIIMKIQHGQFLRLWCT